MSIQPFIADIVTRIEKFPARGAETLPFAIHRNGDDFECQAEFYPADKENPSEASGRLLTDDGQMLEATTGEIEAINGKLELEHQYAHEYRVAQRLWSKSGRDGCV